MVCGGDLVPGVVHGVVHGGDGDPPQEQLQASLAGFGRIHKGAEQKPANMGVITDHRSTNGEHRPKSEVMFGAKTWQYGNYTGRDINRSTNGVNTGPKVR